MNFRIRYSSHPSGESKESVEINTLEELIKFQEGQGCPIIIMDTSDGCKTIEIYDDYRE